MKPYKLVFLLAGFVLLALALRAAGPGRIAAELAGVGPWVAALPLVYVLVYAANAAGWAWAFPRPLPASVPFGDLFAVRLVGESLNCLIPWAASLGGEPVKAQILKERHGVALSESYASLLIVHTTFWTSLSLFILTALALNWGGRSLTPALWKGLLVFAAVLTVGGAALLAGLLSGLFGRIHALGGLLRLWGGASDQKKDRYLALDGDVRRYYFEGSRPLVSTLFNFAAWAAGVIETYWLSRLLGLEITWQQAWLIEMLIQTLRVLTFFIPSSIGAQEGGILVLFTEMGLRGPSAMAFALVRRAREILWIGLGLALLPFLGERPQSTRR